LEIRRKGRNWKSEREGGKGGIGNKEEREELEIRKKGRKARKWKSGGKEGEVWKATQDEMPKVSVWNGYTVCI
jgi:hypothetical protein